MWRFGKKCACIVVNSTWPCKIQTQAGVPLQVYMMIAQGLRQVATKSADKLTTIWGETVSDFAMMFCSTLPNSEIIFQGISYYTLC